MLLVTYTMIIHKSTVSVGWNFYISVCNYIVFTHIQYD